MFISTQNSSALLVFNDNLTDLESQIESYNKLGIPINSIHIHPLNGRNSEEVHNLALNDGHRNHGIPIGHPEYISNCMLKFKLKIEERQYRSLQFYTKNGYG